MKREAKRVRRELTEAERERVEASRAWAVENQSDLLRLAQLYRDHPPESFSTLQDALALLKAERLRQHLSLSDIQERIGIERSNLSRLENEADANPTISTLSRYAEALGKRLFVVLENLPSVQTSAHS